MQGLGPAFKLTINIENTSTDTPSTDLLITFHYDRTLYTIAKPMIQVSWPTVRMLTLLNHVFSSRLASFPSCLMATFSFKARVKGCSLDDICVNLFRQTKLTGFHIMLQNFLCKIDFYDVSLHELLHTKCGHVSHWSE